MAARNEVVRRNLGLVAVMAARYPPRRDFDDLYQEGAMGVMEAVVRYDSAAHPGTSFGTYAAYWIRQRMIVHCRRDNTIPVPHNVHRLESRAVAGEELRPRDAENLRLGRTALETVRSNDDLDCVSPHDLDPAVAAERDEELVLVAMAMDMLDVLEREVISARYGLDGRPARSLDAVSRSIGFCGPTIAKVHRRALARLRDLVECPARATSPPANGQNIHNPLRRTA